MAMKHPDLSLFLMFMLLTGAVLGWSGARAAEAEPALTPILGVGGGPSDPFAPVFNTGSDTRVSLHALLREHTVLVGGLISAWHDSRDISRYEELLGSNTDHLAGWIERGYGAETRDQFRDIWLQHLVGYREYFLARRNGDSGQADAARNELEQLAERLGGLIDHTGSTVQPESLSDHLRNHVAVTLSFIDATLAGDERAKAEQLKAGYDQAGVFAEALLMGILLEHPEQLQ